MQAISQIDLETKQTAIEKPQDKQLQASLVMILTALAEMRQTTIGPEGLRMYAKRLSSFPLSDVKEVIGQISRRPRAEGETAFPAIADIEDLVRQHQVGQRVLRAKEDEEKRKADEFERFLMERMSEGESKEELISRYPTWSWPWLKWKGSMQTDDRKVKASGE